MCIYIYVYIRLCVHLCDIILVIVSFSPCSESEAFSVYTASDLHLKVYCGDIFKFGPSTAGQFDVIWDCNALVAINVEDREKYADILVSNLKQGGRILMTTWIYEQSIHLSVPFSIPPEMVKTLFDLSCHMREVEIIDMTGSDVCKRHELPWAKRPVLLLTKKQ